jgi:hypothetical protein
VGARGLHTQVETRFVALECVRRLAALPEVPVGAANVRDVGGPMLPLELLDGGQLAGAGGKGSGATHSPSAGASSTSVGHHGVATRGRKEICPIARRSLECARRISRRRERKRRRGRWGLCRIGVSERDI